jgi:hypothetical protein
MPHTKSNRCQRLYTDEATAQLERGLQLDSNDLSTKAMSVTASRPAEPDPAGEPVASAQPPPPAYGDGIQTLLTSCSRISSLLLNLSEDIKFALKPPSKPPPWSRVSPSADQPAPGDAPPAHPQATASTFARLQSQNQPRDMPATSAGPSTTPAGDGLPQAAAAAGASAKGGFRGRWPEGVHAASWKDAATRVTETLDQLARVLAPTPIPLGLALLFSQYDYVCFVCAPCL